MPSNSGSDPDFRFWPTALRMSSGVMVWAAHFAVVYGFTALACARGFGGASAWVVGAATLLAASAALAIIANNREREFTRWISAAVAAAALVAIVWEGLAPMLVRHPCA
jgi:1,4-dihydroxy-2-naphthoate octaprenyltransferase